MLITADVAKRESGYSAARDALKIERPSTAGENLYRVAARTGQEYRSIGEKNLVLVHAGSDEDLIEFTGFLQCGTRPGIEHWVPPIDDQRLAAERIHGRIDLGGL